MKESLRRRRRDAEKPQDGAAEDGIDFSKGKTNLLYFLWNICSRVFRCFMGVLPIFIRPSVANDVSSESYQQETETLIDIELGEDTWGDFENKSFEDIELGQIVDTSHHQTGNTPKTKNGGNNKVIVEKRGVMGVESGQKEEYMPKDDRVSNEKTENNAAIHVELKSQSDNDEESLQRSENPLKDEKGKNDQTLQASNKLADYTSHRADSPRTAASILDYNSTHSRRSKATTATGNPAQQLEDALSTAELLLNLPLERKYNDSPAVPTFIEISNSSARSSRKLPNGQSSCSSRLRLSMNNLLADQESTSRRLTDSESSLHMVTRNQTEVEELKRVTGKPNPGLYRSKTGEPFTSSDRSINFSLRRSGSCSSREPIQRQHSSSERIRRTLSNLQMAERKERKAVAKAKIQRTAKSMNVLPTPTRHPIRSNDDVNGKRYSRSKRLSMQQQSVEDDQKSSKLNAQWTSQSTKRAVMPKRGSFARCSSIEAYMQSMTNLNEHVHTDWSSKPKKRNQLQNSAIVPSEIHLSQESKTGQFRRTSSLPSNVIKSRSNQTHSTMNITAALAARKSSHEQSSSGKNAQWTARPKGTKRSSLLDVGVVLAAQLQNSATTGIPSEINLLATTKGKSFHRTSSLPSSAQNMSSPSFQTITPKNSNRNAMIEKAPQRSSRQDSLINMGAAQSAKESSHEQSPLASMVSRPQVTKRRSLIDKGAGLSVQTSVQDQTLSSAKSKSTPWTPPTKPRSHPSGSKAHLDKLATSTINMLNESTHTLLEKSMKKKSVRKGTCTGNMKALADKKSGKTKRTHVEGKHPALDGPKGGKRRASHTNLRILASLNRETRGSSFDLSTIK